MEVASPDRRRIYCMVQTDRMMWRGSEVVITRPPRKRDVGLNRRVGSNPTLSAIRILAPFRTGPFST
jgi:hypothetical protein